jgi:hypothetical protein
MALPPLQPDFLGAADRLIGGQPQPLDGFVANQGPTVSGLGPRTARLQNGIAGQNTRKLIHWLVPEGPVVQMYCNPQSLTINDQKNITPQRTKGGFVIQYWGEDLTTLNIQGTTGTSGIEGINVLRDIYRAEQIAFDPFALYQAARNKEETFAGDVFGIGSAITGGATGGFAGAAGGVANSFLDGFLGASEEAAPQARKQGPTLASLATQIEMYWSGEVYRGFFTSFQVTETANAPGWFDYSMQFTATQVRGFRRNFLGWHRSATDGPSNSNPEFGRPYTFNNLIEGIPGPPRRTTQPQTLANTFESLGNEIASLF